MERRYAFYLIFLLGLWSVVSPWIWGFTNAQAPFWSHIIAGALIALLALWRALAPEDEGRTWASWIVAILGLWSLISPWVFGYGAVTNQMLSDVIAGGLVTILAIWSTMGRRLVHRT